MRTIERPLTWLADALARGEIGAEALLDECLAAIAADDGVLHALLALDPTARAQARACDADRQAGHRRGPLHGVPLVVKDNIDVRGLATTSGCRALAGLVASADAVVVARLRAAGAVILGKANLSEFSFEIRTRSSLGGDTRNPFDPRVTAGGSSGGTAAAVSAGFAAGGLGTDTGGSIRVPAAYTGLAGLRPTHGRLPLAGVAPLAPSTDTVGPIGRRAADIALLFTVMAGAAPAPMPRVAGQRVGLLRQAFGRDPAIDAACARAAAALAAAGVVPVDPVALPDPLLPRDGAHIVDLEFGAAFDTDLRARGFSGGLAAVLATGDYLPDLDAPLRRRLAESGAGRRAVLARHAALRDGLRALLADRQLDALLYPTGVALPASLDNPANGWAPELAACSGWPALTVNAGRASNGLPVGVELLAPPGQEPLLFALGHAIEAGCGPRPLPARASPRPEPAAPVASA